MIEKCQVWHVPHCGQTQTSCFSNLPNTDPYQTAAQVPNEYFIDSIPDIDAIQSHDRPAECIPNVPNTIFERSRGCQTMHDDATAMLPIAEQTPTNRSKLHAQIYICKPSWKNPKMKTHNIEMWSTIMEICHRSCRRDRPVDDSRQAGFHRKRWNLIKNQQISNGLMELSELSIYGSADR